MPTSTTRHRPPARMAHQMLLRTKFLHVAFIHPRSISNTFLDDHILSLEDLRASSLGKPSRWGVHKQPDWMFQASGSSGVDWADETRTTTPSTSPDQVSQDQCNKIVLFTILLKICKVIRQLGMWICRMWLLRIRWMRSVLATCEMLQQCCFGLFPLNQHVLHAGPSIHPRKWWWTGLALGFYNPMYVGSITVWRVYTANS